VQALALAADDERSRALAKQAGRQLRGGRLACRAPLS